MHIALPLAERRSRVYYGWYIVAAATVAQFLAVGSQVYASGVFLKPMTEELGWSRESYSLVQTISTVVMGAAGFAVGGLLDKRGARPLMLVGGAIAAVALMATSQVNTLWQFYLIRGTAMTLGTMLMGNIVVNVTVSKWFVARRGIAVAIAATGVSMGGVLMAPLIAWWIELWDWRTAWVILGCVVGVLIVPTAFVMRRTPEDYGLEPDGMTRAQAAAYAAARKRASAGSEINWTRPEAIRTKTIWLVTLAYGVANVGLGAMLLHLIPYLTDHGFSRPTAAILFSALSWAALIAKPVWGVLMDRYHARYLSAISFILAAVSLLALAPTVSQIGSAWAILIVLIVYGFSIGGTIPLQETVWASYFGRTHLGKIRAVAMPFTIVFGAGGPLLAGSIYDRTGEYSIALVFFSAFCLLGTILVLLARPPRHPSEGLPVEPPPATPATVPS